MSSEHDWMDPFANLEDHHNNVTSTANIVGDWITSLLPPAGGSIATGAVTGAAGVSLRTSAAGIEC